MNLNGMKLRETHNLKVVGSNPTPATTEALENIDVFKGFFISKVSHLANWQTIGKQFDSKVGRRMRPHPRFASKRSVGPWKRCVGP